MISYFQLVYSLRIELTMDTINSFTLASTTGGSVGTCVISEVEFVVQIIELDAQPQSIIQSQNPNLIHIRSQSYRTASNYLAGGSSGLTDILIGTRVSSLKSMFITCSPSNALEKKYASVCPNLGQGTCLVLAGMNVPQRTINPVYHPADAFCRITKISRGSCRCEL